MLVAYAIVTVLGLTRSSQLAEAEKRITALDTELKSDQKLSETLDKYNGLAAADENLTRVLNSRLLFLPGWKAVKGSIPKDIQLTSVTVTNDVTYRFSGESKSVASIANLSHVLEENLQAKNVLPSSINKKPESNLYTFGMSFDIAKASEVAQ